MDEPTATEGLEANSENFVGATPVVGQSIETALVGARHPPETCLPLEDIQRPLVAGSGKARGQDAHLRGHAEVVFRHRRRVSIDGLHDGRDWRIRSGDRDRMCRSPGVETHEFRCRG
ncbi:hypothetical protein D9M72_514690 [compost metagenome]